LITDRFAEFARLADLVPEGTVLDGEILPWRDGFPLPFQALQKRIGRKVVGKKLLAEVPVILKSYDILEWYGEDVRTRSFMDRRVLLEQLFAELPTTYELLLSPLVPFSNWSELESERDASRMHGSEGLMLKHKNRPYRSGRGKGDWWKWKVDPLTIDAIMIYAQAGHGRRANLFTDFTFAVPRDNGELVPFT
jgi:DNA ligase-1